MTRNLRVISKIFFCYFIFIGSVLGSAHDTSLKSALRVPTFNGDDYDRGFKHGQHFKSEINEIIDTAVDYHFGGFFVRSWALYQIRNMTPHIPQKYLDELEGISDGSGVAYNDLLIGCLLYTSPSPRDRG